MTRYGALILVILFSISIPKGYYSGSHIVALCLPFLALEEIRSRARFIVVLVLVFIGILNFNITTVLFSFFYIFYFLLNHDEVKHGHDKLLFYGIFFIMLTFYAQMQYNRELLWADLPFFNRRVTLANWDSNFSALLCLVLIYLNSTSKHKWKWLNEAGLLFFIMLTVSRTGLLCYFFYKIIDLSPPILKRLSLKINLVLVLFVFNAGYIAYSNYLANEFNLQEIVRQGFDIYDGSTVGRFLGVNQSYNFITENWEAHLFDGLGTEYLDKGNLKPHNTVANLALQIAILPTFLILFLYFDLLNRLKSEKNIAIIVPYILFTIPLHSIVLPFYFLPVFISVIRRNK